MPQRCACLKLGFPIQIYTYHTYRANLLGLSIALQDTGIFRSSQYMNTAPHKIQQQQKIDIPTLIMDPNFHPSDFYTYLPPCSHIPITCIYRESTPLPSYHIHIQPYVREIYLRYR